MLNFVSEIGGHLLDDQALLEHKVVQTQDDIQRLEGRGVGALRLKKAEIFVEDEDDEVFEVVEAINVIGVCLTHLSAVIAHLKHKKDVLHMALRIVKVASEELHRFGKALLVIPKID